MSHPLIERLASPDPAARRAACRDASDDPSAVLLLDALARALGDPDRGVARAAADAIVAVARSGADAAGALREALRSDEPRRRWGAALTCARLEPPSPRLLPALVEALGADAGDLRWAAARWLVEIGRLHGEVLPVLLGLVRGAAQPVVRRMATHCLRELAPDLPDAAQALLAASRDADLHVRRASLSALAALLDPPAPVTARLLEALERDEDTTARRIAAVALGELGAAAPGALPASAREALRRARGAPDPALARAAETALARLPNPAS